jgi:hypothetical protein
MEFHGAIGKGSPEMFLGPPWLIGSVFLRPWQELSGGPGATFLAVTKLTHTKFINSSLKTKFIQSLSLLLPQRRLSGSRAHCSDKSAFRD